MGEGILAFLQFALMTFLAVMGANLLVTVGGHVIASYVRLQGRERDLRQKIVFYSRLANGLSQRVEGRKEATTKAASRLFSTQRQEREVKHRLRELETAPYRFVRMVGQEVFPSRPFEFMIFNSSVAHQVKRGERHPFYDPCWASPCAVQVWARNAEEAKEEAERVYPKAAGFKIVYAQPISIEGRTSSSAAPDADGPGPGEKPMVRGPERGEG